jgi:hypothetical protein
MSPTTPPNIEEDRGRWLMSLTALAVHLSSTQIERDRNEAGSIRDPTAPRGDETEK